MNTLEVLSTGAASGTEQIFSITPTDADPFAGVPSRERILENAASVDAEALVAGLEARYPTAMNALRVIGVHPDLLEPQKNLYLSPLPDELQASVIERFKALAGATEDAVLLKLLNLERFDNIGLHCCVVGAGTEAIAQEIFAGEPERIERAAILGIVHDANKAAETQRNKFAKALSIINGSTVESDRILVSSVQEALESVQPGLAQAISEPYADDSYRQFSRLLEKRGVSAEIIDLVLKGGAVAGHGSFSLLTRSARSDGSEGYVLCTDMPEALLVHAVDDHVSSPFTRDPSLILTSRERMVASNFSTRYAWMNTEGIASFFLSAGLGAIGAYEVRDVKPLPRPGEGALDPVSYMAFQPLLADAINLFLADRVGEPDSDPETFLRDRLVKALC